MRLNLTDGKSLVTVHFDRTNDAKDWATIVQSTRPVSTALSLAKMKLVRQANEMLERGSEPYNVGDFSHLHPVSSPDMKALESKALNTI